MELISRLLMCLWSTHQSKPGENEVERLVHHLNVDPELPAKRMRGSVNVIELDGGMDCGEEGTIQPSSTLRDEFGDLTNGRTECEDECKYHELHTSSGTSVTAYADLT